MGSKIEAVRMIMRRYPEWNEDAVAVRIDSDSEVVCRQPDESTPIPQHRSYGYANYDGTRSVSKHHPEPWFIPSQNFQHEGIIGYSFTRFEYEIFKAQVLAEQAQEETA